MSAALVFLQAGFCFRLNERYGMSGRMVGRRDERVWGRDELARDIVLQGQRGPFQISHFLEKDQGAEGYGCHESRLRTYLCLPKLEKACETETAQ